MDTLEIKQKLFEACEKHIDERISSIEEKLASLTEAKNAETKSSAGDKYETTRAMIQGEEAQAKGQLQEARTLKHILTSIRLDIQQTKVNPGSLVSTPKGNYFISIGIGKVEINGGSYFCISQGAPLSQSMLNKKAGESFHFRGEEIPIISVN